MADVSRKNSDGGSRRQQSRLQRRRPASLQISPVSTWNVAIPLLSPLDPSPTCIEQAIEMKSLSSRAESRQQEQHRGVEAEKPVFKKWQHPAAPFCYEAAKIKPSFSVPV